MWTIVYRAIVQRIFIQALHLEGRRQWIVSSPEGPQAISLEGRRQRIVSSPEGPQAISIGLSFVRPGSGRERNAGSNAIWIISN